MVDLISGSFIAIGAPGGTYPLSMTMQTEI